MLLCSTGYPSSREDDLDHDSSLDYLNEPRAPRASSRNLVLLTKLWLFGPLACTSRAPYLHIIWTPTNPFTISPSTCPWPGCWSSCSGCARELRTAIKPLVTGPQWHWCTQPRFTTREGSFCNWRNWPTHHRWCQPCKVTALLVGRS